MGVCLGGVGLLGGVSACWGVSARVGGCIPPPWTEFLTQVCENITFVCGR